MTNKLLIRALIAFVLSFAVSQLWTPGRDPVYGIAAAVIVSILFAAVFARTLKRHDDLNEWIGLELNKIRRIYHLGKNLGTSASLRQWFTDLHGHLYGYLTAFDKKDFSQYQETNGEFRKLSYHLYTVPGLETEKERVLYREAAHPGAVEWQHRAACLERPCRRRSPGRPWDTDVNRSRQQLWGRSAPRDSGRGSDAGRRYRSDEDGAKRGDGQALCREHRPA